MSSWKLPPPLGDRIPEKILTDRARLLGLVEELKAGGRRVVFTNGAFDLLHVGHARSLRHARALGDHLIVALNSDASVRRAKGPNRPLFPLAERMELVATLECVDTVCSFEEDTADDLIAFLRPHIHAKGPDYAAALPERGTVSDLDVEFIVVGDPKDHSSTNLQERLRRLVDGAVKGEGEGER